MVREDSAFLDLPGGGIDHGQSLNEAMANELYEEIDYTGDFTMSLVGAEVLARKQHTGYVLFLMYEVTLLDSYAPRCGKDSTQVLFCNPNNYHDSKDRSLQLLYKYGTRDYTATIEYDATDS